MTWQELAAIGQAIWPIIGAAVGGLMWWLRKLDDRIVDIMRTTPSRKEVATENARLRESVTHSIDRLHQRIDTMDQKIDRIYEAVKR